MGDVPGLSFPFLGVEIGSSSQALADLLGGIIHWYVHLNMDEASNTRSDYIEVPLFIPVSPLEVTGIPKF